MYSWWCVLCSSQLAGRRRRSPAEQNRLTISVPSMSAASYHRNQWLWGWSERLEVNDHVTKAAWNMSSTTPCITDIQLFMLNSDCLGDNGDKSVKFLLMWGKKTKKQLFTRKTLQGHTTECACSSVLTSLTGPSHLAAGENWIYWLGRFLFLCCLLPHF